MSKMYIKTLEVAGIMPALHGMRNPKNSWDKSDTCMFVDETYYNFGIGEADLKLATTLTNAGSEHRKYLRMVQVWADFNMPRYWWAEADTYHFGTKNSCSTMHKLMSTEVSLEDFEYCWEEDDFILMVLYRLKSIQLEYKTAVEEGDTTKINYCLLRAKRILPEGFLQMRTWNTNYEELMNIYHQRKNHRLKEEWVEVFCGWCDSLPYFKELCIDI